MTGSLAPHLATGVLAEQHARRYLERQGLNHVEHNFSCRFGEIDLIMRQKKTLVFVEVRMRRSTRFGNPAETVNLKKQQRLRRTAEFYLIQKFNSVDIDCRFDVVSVTGAEKNLQTQWITNAF